MPSSNAGIKAITLDMDVEGTVVYVPVIFKLKLVKYYEQL
ncbi:hypothetical protein DFP94_1011407 [Fontibacillus phaseoli]|uniref:Uncharacterized protein n=1 Tax=Fontibacillus phaseoli TaxID=1416533 RepID=A0A369BQG5_9BACL|nr:hypothetical protein DFP94_1011407 [Fontibacillus phaseoli]